MEGAIRNVSKLAVSPSPIFPLHSGANVSFATHSCSLPPHSPPLLCEPVVVLFQENLVSSLEDAKAENITVLDVSGKTSLADSFVIASGRSATHVRAIADKILERAKGYGLVPRLEGMPLCDWVVADCGDVVVHIFRPEIRAHYNLEKIWGNNRPSEH